MIDNLALGLSHGLLLLAAWRMLSRPDLDDPSLEDSAVPAPPPPPVRSRRWTSEATPDA